MYICIYVSILNVFSFTTSLRTVVQLFMDNLVYLFLVQDLNLKNTVLKS